MTEAEWLASNDPRELEGCYPRPWNVRKARLYCTACMRHPKNRGRRPEWYELLAHVERLADGTADAREVQASRNGFRPGPAPPEPSGYWDVLLVALTGSTFHSAVETANQAALNANPSERFPCELMREIFGNPFREVTFNKKWRTDTVRALAQRAYDAHEFAALPILADALQDAGCDADDLLNHLRDTSATHVRGCWALDLVLGKE